MMKLTVYLIDDEITFRSQFKRAMKSAGFRTDEFDFVEFDNTDIALRTFRETPGQRLVLFDQNIKAASHTGTGAIREIKMAGDVSSILGIISSSNKPEELAEAKSVGARFWIRKGGGRDAMIEKMRVFKAQVFDNIEDPRRIPVWLEFGLE
jgi:hypothetical protein